MTKGALENLVAKILNQTSKIAGRAQMEVRTTMTATTSPAGRKFKAIAAGKRTLGGNPDESRVSKTKGSPGDSYFVLWDSFTM